MLGSIGQRINRMSYWSLSLILMSLVGIKNGVHPIGPKWIEIVQSAANSFPDAANYMSTSPMPILIYKLLGGSNLLWWAFHFLLILIWTLLFVSQIKKRFPNSQKIGAALFLLSPTWLVILLFIGHYDLFTISGASVAVFSRSKSIQFTGALVAALANPEQAFVTTLLMAALFLVLKERDALRISLYYLVAATATFFAIRIFLNSETGVQRSKVISGELNGVLKTSFGVWSLLPLTLIGISGILVILLATRLLGRSQAIGALIVVYGIPYFFAFAILDKTRVGVAIAAAPYFCVCKYLLEKLESDVVQLGKLQEETLGLAFVLAVLYPTIYFDIDAELRLPYKELLQAFIS